MYHKLANIEMALLEYRKEAARLREDALIMALRLLGEDENSFGPECREVMSRWRPKAEKLLAEDELQPKHWQETNNLAAEICGMRRSH